MSTFHPLKRSMNMLLIGLFFPYCVLAQSKGRPKIDSLHNALTLRGQKDNARVDILNALSSEYYKATHKDSGLYYGEAALKTAAYLNYKKGMITACRCIATGALNLGDTTQAVLYYQKAITISKEGRDEEGMITDLCNLGSLYRKNYLRSLDYYQQASAIAQQTGHDRELADIYLKMARLSKAFARYPEALGAFQEALSTSARSGNRPTEAATLFEIGLFYNGLDDSARAISYTKKSLIVNRQLKNRREVAKSLGMLGAIYMNYHEYDTSLAYYTKCMKILKSLHEKIGLASTYANVAFLYQLLSDYTTALQYHKMSFAISSDQGYQGGLLLYYKDVGNLIQVAPDSILFKMGIKPGLRYKTAVDYGIQALRLAQMQNNPVQQKYVLQILIPAYEKMGNYKAAYQNLKSLTAMSDSISDQTKQKRIVQKEVEFDFEQKAAAARAAREKEALKQRTIRNSLLAGLILLSVFTIIVLRQRNRTRKARERAERSERQKQRFFANISHEFRTPLTLLIGPLEDLMAGGDVAAFKTILPEMHRNSKRLLGLINQLLDLSRLDGEKYKVNTTRTDIIPFTNQIIHAFSSLAQTQNIDLETRVGPHLRASLNGTKASFYFDGEILEKILINLLSNAFKFTPAGGRITVTLDAAEHDPAFLELKVEDNGVGIPGHLLPFIYDRFYQIENSHSQVAGSGIGLSLIKELVDLHEGKIFVRSKEGEGTAFTCLFPLNKKIVNLPPKQAIGKIETVLPLAEEQTKENAFPKPSGKNSNPLILVIEDQQDVRKYICAKLTDQYVVREAQNGRQGLQMAMEHLPDLVISDVMMPMMDGFELCKSLKTTHITSHIPVILLTARAEDSDKMAGLETGADAYIIKPFNSRELLLRVKNLITSRNQMRSKFSGRLIVKPAEIAVTSLDQAFMEKLLKAVEDHIDDRQFSVEALSRAANMGTSQLNRKLKAIINQPATQFIRSVRLQRAMEMLKKEAGTISEIAFKTGFETPSYFTKMFKAQFGCLPSEREKFPESA